MLIYSFITDYQAFSLRYKDNTTRDKNETKVGKQSANLGKNNEPIQNWLSFLIDCKSVILHHLTILSFPMVRPAWDNWWIPEKPLITAVFFDVDGTLTDAQGKVPENYANVLHYMAQSVPLYLATSLSVEQARRKLGKTLFSLFKGGAFADGGLLLYDGRNRCLSVELLPDVNGESAKITAHSYEGQVYKYSMLVYEKEQRENILSRLKAKPYQVFYKPPLITVVHKEAGKKKGVLHICKVLAFPLEQVLIVGNSQKDWEMMSAVPHSCAVMNSEPFLTEHARYTLNPDRLPAFFRFRE